MLTKSLSCNEIWAQQVPPDSSCAPQSSNNRVIDSALAASKRHKSSDKLTKTKAENHKTVIYFGDSISSKKQHNQLHQQMKAQQVSMNQLNAIDRKVEPSDLKHAQRLCDEMVFKRQQSGRNHAKDIEVHSNCSTDELVTVVNDVRVITNDNVNMNIVKHLKSVIEEKCLPKCDKSTKKEGNEKNTSASSADCDDAVANSVDTGRTLPPYIESIVNGVINIKIDDSYDAATKLVRSLENDNEDTDSFDAMDDGNEFGGEVNNMYLDWSFVQDWRSR